MRCCGIYLIAISQKILQIFIIKMSLKFTNFRLYSNPPGTIELSQKWPLYRPIGSFICWAVEHWALTMSAIIGLYHQRNPLGSKVISGPPTQRPCHCQISYSASLENTSTHWGWDKMAAIFQTTFSNAFSWMNMYEYWSKYHWSLFLRVQLIIFQHWFR